MTKQDAAEVLRHYAVLVELLGDDPFRARAFDNAARMLEVQPESLETLLAEKRLHTIKGIGKGVAAAIMEIAERGTFADLEEAQEKVPVGVLDLLRIEGLGPKRARTLWMEGKVASLEQLDSALQTDRLAALSGFGAKSVEKLRAGLAFLRAMSGRHWRHHAHRAADAIRETLSGIAGTRQVLFGGSLRRGMETVGDLDVVVVVEADALTSVREYVLTLPDFIWHETGEVLKGHTKNGFPIDLSVTSPREAVLRKLIATGSKEHVAALREAAAPVQRTLDEIALGCESEEDVYRELGLTYTPPALREGMDSVRSRQSLPYPQPVSSEQIRGILHCHTTASDGHHTLRELAEAMIAKGYEYLGIADHSQSAAYARGLTPDRVRIQWAEIDVLNRELAPFRILKGTEADILADGRLDFDDDLLAGFDFVVASVHSGFAMSESAATERLCRALSNTHVNILGHPTGRLLLERNGYAVNHEKLLECAAQHGKAIELNCNPHRFDLDWRWLARAEELGVPVPLCPDAHSIEGLWDIRFGIEVAAKGPLTAANCPSAWTADQFVTWCDTRKRPL